MIKAENELPSPYDWTDPCVLEHGDRPILGKGFLGNGQPLSQSVQIKRVQELWEGRELPLRSGSWYRMGCKASLGSLFPCGVQMGWRTVVTLMLCCEGASLGRWLITQARFYHLVAQVQSRHPGCLDQLEGALPRSNPGVGEGEPEQGWESRLGTPWQAPNR